MDRWQYLLWQLLWGLTETTHSAVGTGQAPNISVVGTDRVKLTPCLLLFYFLVKEAWKGECLEMWKAGSSVQKAGFIWKHVAPGLPQALGCCY